MNFRQSTLGFVLFGLILVAVGFFGGRLYGTNHPESEPYTPTKIEWLATESQALLNATFDYENLRLIVTANPDHPNTLDLVIRTVGGGTVGVGNEMIDYIERHIQSRAQAHGWDWVEIRTFVKDPKLDKLDIHSPPVVPNL